jgi:branched-chain amino acid transport system substrate-binding protein
VVGIPQNRSGAATTILKTMKEKGILKIAVMSDNTAFGKAGKEQIEKLAPIHGIEIIANEVYDKNTTDITDVLTKIKGARAQAVINWSLMPARSVVSRDIKRIELGVPLFQGPEVGNDR